MSEFSKTLRELARMCGKSEYELAKLTGRDPSFVHRLMSGEKNPSLATIMQLAIALPMDKELAKSHPYEMQNILGVLMLAAIGDASAKSIQSRE